jgi:ATP-binding cassette subfamily B protein
MTLSQYFNYLKPYFLKYQSKILIILCSVILVSGSLLFLGQNIKNFIHIISSAKNLSELYTQFLYIILTIAIFSIASFFRSYNIGILTEDVSSEIRLSIYKSLMTRDQSYFDNY